MSFHPLPSIFERLCIQCGLCLDVCPAQAICVVGDRFVVGPECTGCAACFEACPKGAVRFAPDES